VTSESKWYAALFVVVMWTAISVVAWPGIALQLRLRAAAGVAEGEVVNVDTRNHNRATYRYTVADLGYANSEVASHRHVGDKVRVYYSPQEPSASMLLDPKASIRSDLFGLFILYAFVATSALVMAARSSRGRAKGESS
jgi:hypothetical protein